MDIAKVKDKVIAVLKEVYDPELPVNVYDLGLIYAITWHKETQGVHILMTLTTPNCPASEIITHNIQTQVQTIPEVRKVVVDITFEPAYTLDRLSEDAKLLLGIEGKL